MRSSFGDYYIHYSKENYDKYGVNKKGIEKNSKQWKDVYREMKQKISTKIDDSATLVKDALFLEKEYNELFYPKSKEKYGNFYKELEKVVKKRLNDAFGFQAGKLNNQNYSIESTKLFSEYNRLIGKAKERVKIDYLKQDATITTIQNRLIKLQEELSVDKWGSLNDKKDIKKGLEDARNKILKIQQDIKKDGDILIRNKDIESINTIIKQYNRVWLPSRNQSGELFEWLVPLIQLQTTNCVENAVYKDIKKLTHTNIGSGYVKVQLNQSNNKHNLNRTIRGKNQEKHIEVFNERNKTDVIISYNQNGDLKQKNVSAKNTSGNKAVLAQNTSLFTLLQLSQNYFFVNHYLNVITTAKKVDKDHPGGKSRKTNIVQANDLIKALFFKMGAEGYDKVNPAEMLIVNDKKNKHIYVYNIKVLTKLIQNKMLEKGNDKYRKLVKGFKEDFTIQQQFLETKEARIENVIQQTQNIKIPSIVANTTILKQYINLFGGK